MGESGYRLDPIEENGVTRYEYRGRELEVTLPPGKIVAKHGGLTLEVDLTDKGWNHGRRDASRGEDKTGLFIPLSKQGDQSWNLAVWYQTPEPPVTLIEEAHFRIIFARGKEFPKIQTIKVTPE